MRKFKLYNNEGCYFDECTATSVLKARQIFALSYEGTYKIISMGTISRVRL